MTVQINDRFTRDRLYEKNQQKIPKELIDFGLWFYYAD